MALSIEQAKALVIEFCAAYPVAATIGFKIRETQEELYGPNATREAAGTILGSFHPRRGRALFAVAGFRDEEHFRRVVRHEILGHFGINTFHPQEKRALLEAIIQARNEPGLRDTWAVVDRNYPGIEDLRKAEEVYAFSCEAIEPHLRTSVTLGAQALQQVCIEQRRPLTFEDLINLTTMVAEGLHDRTRSQQTFPESDSAQFKQDTLMRTSEYPVWLAVQPDDREKMRTTAGQLSDGRSAVAWDKEEKLWFARPGCDLDRINEWLPDRSMRAGGGDPEAEFLDVLTQAGLIVKGMPVMNGTRQRVATTDDKGGKNSGVYSGYLDRRPGGWFINYHRTADVTNWSATGGKADPVARLHIRAAAKQSQEDAARQRAANYARQTRIATRLYDRLPAADPAHPYLVRKGIPPTPEIRQTRNGALVVPFFSAEGNFKSLQYIPASGDKRLFKGAPKKGNFLVVGGALEPGQPILYAEGYATARSLNLATGRPVVMTIDAGNMVTVAHILHQQFPGSQHLFMADFDHAKPENKGLLMATEAANAVGGHVAYPVFNESEIAQGFTDFNDLHQSRGLHALREHIASLFQPAAQYDEESPVPDQPNTETPGVFLTPKIRQTLEKEWSALQSDFFKQQLQLADQLKTDLRAALKAEKTELKSQDTQSLTFGERIAASVGLMEPGSNGLQIAHLNHALKQLNKAEHEGWTTRSFDGQRMKLQEVGQYAIDMGRPNPAATGDMAKDRDTWVSEQAAIRLSGAGLAPLAAVDINAQAAQFAEQMQARIAEIVQEAKQDPFRTVDLANQALRLNVADHAAVQAQRFTPEELQGSVAIFTRADAYADAIALSPDGSSVPATVATEDVVKWAELDVKDLAVIQAEPLREMATETMIDNTQSVPVYAEQIGAAGIDLTAQAPAAEQPTPSESPNVSSAPAESEAPAVSAEPLSAASNDQVAPAAEAVAPEVEAAPALVAEAQTAAVEPAPSINAEIQPASVNVEVVSGAVEPALVNASSDNTVQVPTTTAEAPLADLTAASAASNEPQTVALPELKQAVPETAQPSPVQPTVAASLSAQVDEPIEPTLIAPTVVASAAFAAETDAPAQMTEDLAALMPRRPAANEAPAAESVMNFINVGPRIGQDEPPLQPSHIDKDSLLTRITNEVQGDNSVLYKLDNEPAFVDRGSRLEMAPGAGQSDEKILAALLTAARFYRGQIELTGSDAFKAKAIELIVQNQVNVSMKNPAQQLMLDQSRQALNLSVVKADAIHGDTPAPFDPAPPATAAMSVATAGSTSPTSPAVPEQQSAPTPVTPSANNAHVPLAVSDPITLTHNAAQRGPVDDAPPLGAARQTQEIKTAVVSGDQAPGTGVDAAIHQLSTSAAQGVTGKVLSCGKAPFRFDPENSESVHIKLRTKTGVQTFWGKELAGLLRDTRIEPGRMATLQYLGEKHVTVKTPVKDPNTGLVLHYEDKQAKRNQWSLGLVNGTAVRTGDDQGVKLVAYDAARFDMIQKSIMTQLNVPIDAPPRPADGLFWMTPNGQGSARAGDELSAPRPEVDTVDVGKPVMSSWSQDGQLDMALFRGDGPYLQGVMRQGNEYQHVLVSLPGHSEAPPMVINQVTDQGLVPIGVGNGINRSGGEPVSREHIAFKLDGDSAVRIGKLDFPREMPPALHARLGFDQRWKDTQDLPKSGPAAAPKAEPNAMRPA